MRDRAPTETFTLTVSDGFGGGTYVPGDGVHVFADVDPYAYVVTRWRSSIAGVSLPAEWHFTFAMPASDVTLTPTIVAVPMEVSEIEIAGAMNPKRVLYAVPDSPRGAVFIFHGDEGSAEIINLPSTQYLARLAYHRGYIVVSMDAEEVTLGAPGLDGKLRWDLSTNVATNIDLQNVELLSAALSTHAGLAADAPRFAVGVSNGGTFSVTVGAALPFTAVTSFCAPGTEAAWSTTTTPSQWLMCSRDTNETVDALRPIWRDGTTNLTLRAIPTDYDELLPSPLFAARFARVDGIDAGESTEMVAEFRANDVLGAGDFLLRSPDDILADIAANPGSWPRVVTAATRTDGLHILAEVKQTWADHTMYDDWATRCLDFLETQAP